MLIINIITVIVGMPEKMRTALNQFFTQRHEDEEAKLLQKIWAFSAKIIIFTFYVSTIFGPFEGGPWGKCLQGLTGIRRLLFVVKYLILDFTKYFLAAETYVFIR